VAVSLLFLTQDSSGISHVHKLPGAPARHRWSDAERRVATGTPGIGTSASIRSRLWPGTPLIEHSSAASGHRAMGRIVCR
jgi:hypothetical protein